MANGLHDNGRRGGKAGNGWLAKGALRCGMTLRFWKTGGRWSTKSATV